MSELEVDVLFFAKSREIVGKTSAKLTLPANLTYKQLAAKVINSFQLELIQESVIIAVNEEFLAEDASILLRPGDKLAVIPPLSGG